MTTLSSATIVNNTISLLTSLEFREYPNHYDGTKRTLQLRLDRPNSVIQLPEGTKGCCLNDGKMFLNVSVDTLRLTTERVIVEFEVTVETDAGRTFTLSETGVRAEELTADVVKDSARRLVNAWRAVSE